VLLCSCPFIAAGQEPAATQPSSTAGADSSEGRSHIDELADQRVRAMSDFLAKQQKFRFSVEIVYDSVEPDGQKIQLGRRSKAEVMRPNGLRAETVGDRGWNNLSVFDGKHFLLHVRGQNLYSRVETPGTLDEFFKFLFDKYGMSPPLVDFLMSDVHEALTSAAETGGMLGDAFVAEKECEHIAFSGKELDWQIWIEKGSYPWPRKFVITYKDVDVRPQFMAVFREWEANIPLESARFATAAPEGATEVPFERFTANEGSATEETEK
jgi:hypothetical protein